MKFPSLIKNIKINGKEIVLEIGRFAHQAETTNSIVAGRRSQTVSQRWFDT
jgi:hypothetical protein